MHTNLRVALLVPVLSVLFLAGCGGPERIVLRGGTSHFPLLHKRVMRYQEQHNGVTKDYTLEMLYMGGRSIRAYEARFKGIKAGLCNFISKDSVVYFETDQPLTSTMLLTAYRQVWVDENAEYGSSWIDDDMGTETVIAGFETVSVPAGTFADCYKTVVTPLPGLADSLQARLQRDDITKDEFQRQLPNVNTVVVRWFAKDVGLVKEQIGSSDFVRELVEIVSPGTGLAELPITRTEQPIEVETQ